MVVNRAGDWRAPSVAVLFGVDTSVICYCDPPLSEARNHLSKFNFRFQA
jgi:hypothetical protein